MSTRDLSRRRILQGAGGISLGLPMLDIFLPKTARAQAAMSSPFVVFVVNSNGVVQAGKDITGKTDPEKFWPTSTGTITTASLTADKTDRATGELAEHASRLLMVRGINHPFAATGCQHASGDAQLLTAAEIVGNSNKAQSNGESIDSRIAREKNPTRNPQPLALHAGKYSPSGMAFSIPGYISYVGSKQPRTPDASPYQAYQRMVGQANVSSSDAKLIGDRRKSVNDLLRGQIKALLGRKDLSQSDRERLDQHFTAVRDLEITVSTQMPADQVASMQTLGANPYSEANHEALAKLHLSLMAFALSSGFTKTATLKIGDREDDHTFTVDGVRWNGTFHTASHREGTDPLNRCMYADRVHAKLFKGFLDQLAAITTPTGKLVDQGVSVWTNQVANGNHSFVNVPFILAGSANGYLKQGAFVQVTKTTNLMLNTLLNAAGVRKAGGAPVDDFGAASLTKGVISELIA